MLRRFVLVQKRHLEAATTKCSCLTHRLVYKNGQRTYISTKPLLSVPPSNSSKPLDTSLPPQTKIPPSDRFPRSLVPPEFDHITVALDLNQPVEKILQFVKKSPPLLELFSSRRKIREIAEELARSSKPRQAIHILNITHQLGNTLSANAYESVSFHVAQGRRWDVVLGVVGAARNHVQHVTLKLLNWRARALMETHQYSLLHRILEEFQAAEIAPTQMTYHIILSGCMRNNNMEGAQNCLQEMRKAGIPVDSTTHSLINSHRHFNADPQVRHNALVSLPSLRPAARIGAVNRLIQSALDEDDVTSTLEYLSIFQPESVAVITSVFQSHLGVSEKPAKTSLSMDLKPNADTFAVCMNYFIKKSNLEVAIRLGIEPFSVPTPPTPGLVTSLTHAYFLDGRGDTAIHMLSQLSCASKGWHALLTNVQPTEDFPLLNREQLSLTTRMCNALLRGSLKRQGLSSVPSIFAIMHANDITPNERTVEILLSFMNNINVSHPRTFFQLLRALTAKSSLQPAIHHMHTIVSRIFREEKKSVVSSAWSPRVARKGIHEGREKPRLVNETESFDPLSGIQLGKHLSYRTAARPTVQSLSDREVMTDSAMIFLRMRRASVLHSDMESAKAFFRTLTARGFRPNAYHVGALVEGYALAGKFDSAMDVITTAGEWGIKPNVVMYTSLISAHARRRDLTSAMRTFEEMVKLGISPDMPSIDALVSAFYSRGKHSQAQKLLKELWHYIQPFPKSLETADLDTLLSHFRSLGPPSKKAKYTKSSRIKTFYNVRRIIRTYRRYFDSRPRAKPRGRERRRKEPRFPK